MLSLVPITIREANAYVARHHRRHGKVPGAKFAIGVASGSDVVGVVLVGRPVSRRLDDDWTAEVIRCCTDGTRNACSMLYRAAWRACRAMGYHRLVTYTGKDEPGTSLVASGWKLVGEAGGGNWNKPGRPRVDTEHRQRKLRWEFVDARSHQTG